MIYGTPAVTVVDDQTDRIGIRTLILGQLWQPVSSGDVITQAEIDAQTPGTPAVPGGLLYTARQSRRKGGAMYTTWTYEGVDGDGRTPTFRGRSNSLDYTFEPGFAQVDILLHWNFAALQQKYGGSVIDGEVTWPPTIGGSAGSSGSTTGLPGPQASQSRTNPMFGIKDFLRLEGTYSFRYASLSRPSNARIGQIVGSGGLPGVSPSIPAGRNWLVAPVKYRRRGTIFDVTEEYWLSGPGGWPEPVYGNDSNSAPDSLDYGLSLNQLADQSNSSAAAAVAAGQEAGLNTVYEQLVTTPNVSPVVSGLTDTGRPVDNDLGALGSTIAGGGVSVFNSLVF